MKKFVGTWNPGEVVYNFGEPPEFAYLVVTGQVEFFTSKNIRLGDAGPSEVFGEISCYLNRSHSVTAKAKTHLVAKKIQHRLFTGVAGVISISLVCVHNLSHILVRT